MAVFFPTESELSILTQSGRGVAADAALSGEVSITKTLKAVLVFVTRWKGAGARNSILNPGTVGIVLALRGELPHGGERTKATLY